VESEHSKRHRTLLVLAATATLAASWSGAALGHTQPGSGFAGIAADLQSLDTPSRVLEVDDVDHQPAQRNDAAPPESRAVDVTTMDLATPELRLGPRVSNALQDIFGLGETSAFGENDTDMTVSPVAETEEPAESTELTVEPDAATDAEGEIDLPLLQRQMYRTDI